MARNVENRKAPSLLGQRLKVRLDEDLNRIAADVDFNASGSITKIHLVTSAALSSDDRMGHGQSCANLSLFIAVARPEDATGDTCLPAMRH